MSKATISGGQARSLIGSFATDTPWDEIDVDLQPFIQLPPLERGKLFAAFLRNGCRLSISAPGTVIIDRSKPFDPKAFMGPGWKIGAEDKRALTITEFNITKILLQTGLNEGETVLAGKEKRKRLISQAIQLDAKIAQTLIEERGQLTLRSMHEHLGVTRIEFLGTVLLDPGGEEYALCLNLSGGGSWSCGYYHLLASGRNAGTPAVGLAG